MRRNRGRGSVERRAGALKWGTLNKLAPPPVKILCLPRTDLVAMVEAHSEGGITMACAPPGFGKTLLSSLVYTHLKSRKWACAWLTIGAEHRAVEAFRSDLRAALTHAKVPPNTIQPARLRDPGDMSPEDSVLDALDGAPRRIALFLDGLDLMIGSEALRCVARIAKRLPSHAHLMLSSRRASILDLSRHLVAGNLLQLGADVLRFTDDETGELLKGLVDRARLDEVVSTLVGWPVAVQLARLLLQRAPGRNSVTTLLADGPDMLGRYIDEQILGPLTTATQEFLTCAAELRTDSGEVVDAARSLDDRYRVRAELTELDPLIRVEADAVCTFHAHPAIAARLRRLPVLGESLQNLHSRAADWLIGRGDAAGAVKHLVAAGDVVRAAELIERTGFLTLAADLGPATLNALVRLVPASVLAGLPRARLVWIAMLLNDGRREEATAEFQRATAEADPHYTATQPGFLRDVQLVESYFRSAEDRFPSSAELDRISREAALLAGSEPAVILWRLLRADFRRAQSEIEHLAGIVSRTGYRFDAACLAMYRGMVAFGTGDLDAAERAHTAAAALDPGTRTSHPSVMMDIPRAEMYYERNALTQAADLLAPHKPEHHPLEEWFDVFVARNTIAAKLLHARGDIDAAALLLRSEATAARFHGLAARHVTLTAARVEILLQAGRSEDAVQAGRDLPTSLSAIGDTDALPWRLIDLLMMAHARLALARDDAAESLRGTQDLMSRWDKLGLVRGSIRTRLLAAAALSRLGAVERSHRWILEALEAARRTRHLRVLLDERTLLAASLSSFTKSATALAAPPQIIEFAAQLLHILDTEQRSDAAGLRVFLSPRERDVLIGLSHGQTNKMIALSCHIAENTVKHHLRHVYRKLKVRRRVQAVEEARRRSLIP